MLPGYGFSTFPDFQPHLYSFCCRGKHPSMWIPDSAESQDLSEPQESRPFLHPCHHNHIAVCQQETLAFIELQPPGTPKLNCVGCPRSSSPDRRCAATSLALNGFTLNELNDMYLNDCHRTNKHESTLSLNSHASLEDGDLECNTGIGTPVPEKTEKPHAVTTVCRPLHAALSLPLSLPLSSLHTDRDSWESQFPCSSSSPECPGFQGLESYQPQRRASQGSLKEKSIRRKIQVYSSESLSDNSQCSPNVEADYIFPGPFASFLEEDLNGLSTLEDISSPSFSDYAPDLPNSHNDAFDPPAEPLQIIEDSVLDEVEGTDIVDTSTTGETFSSRNRQGDHERRRFSASELISRLQLSQRKNSFTLKLGKSLSARVASRDRQVSNSVGPNLELKHNSKNPSSRGSFDSAPHSPIGPTPTLLTGCDNSVHRRSTKLTMRKKSIEEDLSILPTVSNSNRLSRFLPSSILYQEYSDVAINREIQRQQGKEPGQEEEGLREDESDGTPSPSNLSPSSSFRSSRGSAFALWQDIPDVRSSGQLDNFSNEERKLQEAKFELVTSEASYIRSLTIAVDHFMLSQELAECLGTQDKHWLFSKLPEVKDVSERFLQDLEHRLEKDILRFDVCDIVLHHCPALRKVYLPYVTNQAYQEQTYQRLLQENPRFHSVLARLEEDPICQRLPLTSFLILPFQRITRLKMLVENILKRTNPGSRDEDTATKAFNELKKIIKECNSSVQSMKRMEELIHLNKKIHFEGKIFPLISQSRWLVKHGELLEVDTNMSGSKFKFPTKPVYLHLFNDSLLLSRRKDTWKFMVFVHAKIGELKVKDLSQTFQGISGFIFHLQLCEGPQLKHQILLKSNTESGKQRWITAMFPSDPLEDIEQASENVDISQVQCIKSYKAQEHDELTLEKAEILHAKTITSDGWVEGIRLSDGERGWFPKTYVEEITSRSARLRNLRENIRIKCVTQKLKGDN
ncbi:rho guanine nucleotide exchange factor 19 isoform X1 [Takifugu flavidus]|uniref:rho guanine nucleotide exchange factor 19 isoform X1 n=1 Tax=Takifugu flavidus TaxID=433684 RepID=UPI00254450F4|nr:rho guanine nucleotide exchange factor 19 isoform X1 [Takifugu flavidus]XP_056896543.1 rho guanine nucleotide exchange factor 19 isoform X1 [Takifugu flavidus]XP_056896544.1 rho guanine nucleotide exchange factor 19 isoform X1 [Takifugu flavidus]XP_056896545.1 rho guanine nucleotide exchange factor 19 isoform X1 [Takifugu flavidus]